MAKKPEELTKEELVQIIYEIKNQLVGKEWGADTAMWIFNILHTHQLVTHG